MAIISATRISVNPGLARSAASKACFSSSMASEEEEGEDGDGRPEGPR